MTPLQQQAVEAVRAMDAWRPGGSDATEGEYAQGRQLAHIASQASIAAIRELADNEGETK